MPISNNHQQTSGYEKLMTNDMRNYPRIKPKQYTISIALLFQRSPTNIWDINYQLIDIHYIFRCVQLSHIVLGFIYRLFNYKTIIEYQLYKYQKPRDSSVDMLQKERQICLITYLFSHLKLSIYSKYSFKKKERKTRKQIKSKDRTMNTKLRIIIEGILNL